MFRDSFVGNRIKSVMRCYARIMCGSVIRCALKYTESQIDRDLNFMGAIYCGCFFFLFSLERVEHINLNDVTLESRTHTHTHTFAHDFA